MKKCSKCGIVLDDSKKKCYMCGADLSNSSSLNKLNNFNSDIGATVSSGHDNVFSDNTKNKNDNAEIESLHENIFFKEPNGNKKEFFKNEMNSLNSKSNQTFARNQSSKNNFMKKDNKLLDKKKKEAQEAALKKEQEKESIKKARLEQQKEKERLEKERALQKQEAQKKEKELKEAELKLKKEREERIKLEAELKKKQQEEEKLKNIANTVNVNNVKFENNGNDNASLKVKNVLNNAKLSSIMNGIVFVVFIIAIIVVCFHFLGNNGEKNVSLGSLKYTMPEEFKLETSDGYSKYYNHGDGCSIRVTYGSEKGGDSYVDDYLNGIKEHYQSQNDLLNRRETIKINDNVWESLVISQLPDDGIYAGIEGFIKYQYVAIVYQNNSYTIVYTNTENDNTCSAMFNEFIDTLKFK